MLGMMALTSLTPLTTRPCRGDDSQATPEGITVTGVGTVKAHPSVAEIRGTISGAAELAADANVKYLDERKKAIESLDALKNPDLSVEPQGPLINQAVDAAAQMRMMQGMGGAVGKPQVQVTQDLKLTLKNIDKLEPDKLVETIVKIIDAGRDAGIQVGPPPPRNFYQLQMEAQNGGSGDSLVVFKLPDTTQVEREAYGKAVDDARTRAALIANLNGVKLGRVRSVEVEDSGGGPPANSDGVSAQPADEKSLESALLTEIPVTVRLTITFEIVPATQPSN